jgi:phage-related protein
MVRLDADAVVIAEVFGKKTRTTPSAVIEACRERLRRYDEAARR